MQTIDLNHGGKVNLWFEKKAYLRLKEKNIISKDYNFSKEDAPLRKVIIAEMFLPRGGRNIYGLLGIEYETHNSNSLKIIIQTDNRNISTKTFAKSLISKFEPTFVGLPEEYSKYILQAIDQTVIDKQLNFQGKLRFCYGAYSEVSSNGWVFKKLTELLLSGLFWPVVKISKETIENIIHNN